MFKIETGFDDVVSIKSRTLPTGGGRIHFCSNPNPNALPSYRDDSGQPQQHDSALVMDLEGVPPEHYSELIERAIERAHQSAILPPYGLVPGTENTKDGDNHQMQAFQENGGSTGTLMIYNPQTFTVDIGSKGDSPAFLILDDGSQVHAVKITSSFDGAGGAITNCLNDETNVQYPVRPATYTVGGATHEGTVDLALLIQQAKTAYGLSPNTKASLLITSDGLLKPYPDGAVGEEARVATLYKKAQQVNHPNRAETMTNFAISNGSYDNLSAVLIEHIEKGKGQPVAAAVCDGFYKYGYIASQAALQAIGQTLTEEKFLPKARKMVPSIISGWAHRKAAELDVNPHTANGGFSMS